MKPEINFEAVDSMKTRDDFIPLFCRKVIRLLEEFEEEYTKGLRHSDTDKLSDITHKISSTMKLLKLDDFYEFTRSYKNLDLENQDAKDKLLNEALTCIDKLKNDLRLKMEKSS